MVRTGNTENTDYIDLRIFSVFQCDQHFYDISLQDT